MKILQINSVYEYGSTGRITSNLHKNFEKQGIESFVIYGRGKEIRNTESRVFKIGNNIEMMRHVLLTRIFDSHGKGSIKSTKKMNNLIKKIKPDIIILHNIHGYYVNIFLLVNYISSLNIPILWVFHDAWAMSGHPAHFELDENGKIPTKNLETRQKYEYPKSILYDRSSKNFIEKSELFKKINFLTIITPSNWLSDLVKISYFSKRTTKVINNGIDIEKFKKLEYKLIENYQKRFLNKKIILGVASAWTEKKGLHIFEELVNIISNDYVIVLIGIDKKTKARIDKRITCIERTESIDELVVFYNIASVFVNPTFEDNFPTTNIEALACGTPVITFDTGGSPEALDKDCGIVTQTKTAQSILEAINDLEISPLSPEKCVERGKKYSLKLMFDQYNRLIFDMNKDELNED